jgi:hypothetical protein
MAKTPALPGNYPTIVAEISKTWRPTGCGRPSTLLAQQFEDVIEVNRQRGYSLTTWQLHRQMVAFGEMNETIIAVFVRGDQ